MAVWELAELSERLTLTELSKRAHQNSVNHGWWEGERNFGESIALIHSEVSEALEDWRDGLPFDKIRYSFTVPPDTPFELESTSDGQWIVSTPYGMVRTLSEEEFLNLLRIHKIPVKPVGIPVELADVIIRVLDLCGGLNIDIEKAVLEKMKYNEDRPYRHGGKLA